MKIGTKLLNGINFRNNSKDIWNHFEIDVSFSNSVSIVLKKQ